jgi:hypothetical protein
MDTYDVTTAVTAHMGAPWARVAWLHRAPESGVADDRPSCTRRYHCGFFTAQFQAKHGRG